MLDERCACQLDGMLQCDSDVINPLALSSDAATARLSFTFCKGGCFHSPSCYFLPSPDPLAAAIPSVLPSGCHNPSAF
jgi:hypothetical protein